MSAPTRQSLLVSASALMLAASPAAWSQSVSDADTIEELRQVIQQQQQQLELLMQKVDQLEATASQTVTEDVPYADTADYEAHKEPRVISSGIDKVKLSISGQINRAFLATDDGEESDYFFVDNDNSSTRFRFIGDGQVSEDLSVTAALELDAKSNSSSNVSQIDEQSGSSVGIRRAEVLVSSNKFGTGYLGRGWTASDSTAEIDLSGTDVVNYSGVADMAGGMRFRKDDGTLTAFTVFSMFDNLDGLGRNDRFRYDTPEFAGFVGSVSATTEQNQWDAAVTYAAEIGDFDLAGKVAYWKKGDQVARNSDGTPANPFFADPARKDGVSGSVSVLHDIGVNVTLAGGRANSERSRRDDPQYWYAKLGYIAQIWGIGNTNLSIDYWNGNDYVENGSTSESVGIAVVQELEQYGTDLYASYRHYNPELQQRLNPDGSLPAPGSQGLKSLDAFMLGARVKF